MNLLHSALRSISEGGKLLSDVIIAYDLVNFSDISSMDWAGCAHSYAAHILSSKASSILREQKLLKENYRSLVSSAWTLFFYDSDSTSRPKLFSRKWSLKSDFEYK